MGRQGVEKPPKRAFQTIFSERTDRVDNIERVLVLLADVTFCPGTSENPIRLLEILGLSHKVKRSLTYLLFSQVKSSLHLQSSQRGCNLTSGGVTADRVDFGVMYVRHTGRAYI